MTMSNMVRSEQKQPERSQERATVAPAIDIYENDQEILLLGDLPGVTKDRLSVHLDKDVLTIDGKREPSDSKGLLRGEFRELDYYRAFTLPSTIDADKVVATLEDGILKVTLPKRASVRPRRIEIKS
jgi:HSP20 family molecular chaperone IbpA